MRNKFSLQGCDRFQKGFRILFLGIVYDLKWSDLCFEDDKKYAVLRWVDHIHSLFIEVLLEYENRIGYPPTSKVTPTGDLIDFLVILGEEEWLGCFMIMENLYNLTWLKPNFMFIFLENRSLVNIARNSTNKNLPFLDDKILLYIIFIQQLFLSLTIFTMTII